MSIYSSIIHESKPLRSPTESVFAADVQKWRKSEYLGILSNLARLTASLRTFRGQNQDTGIIHLFIFFFKTYTSELNFKFGGREKNGKRNISMILQK